MLQIEFAIPILLAIAAIIIIVIFVSRRREEKPRRRSPYMERENGSIFGVKGVNCPKCGDFNALGIEYCGNCGTELLSP